MQINFAGPKIVQGRPAGELLSRLPRRLFAYLFHLGGGEDFAGLDAIRDESLDVRLGFCYFGKCLHRNVCPLGSQGRVNSTVYFYRAESDRSGK